MKTEKAIISKNKMKDITEESMGIKDIIIDYASFKLENLTTYMKWTNSLQHKISVVICLETC
jgi:hypothetical protein